MSVEIFVGRQGGITARSLRTLPGEPPRGVPIEGRVRPGSARPDRNSSSEALGLNKPVDWPYMGFWQTAADWNKAKGFVPEGWVRVLCRDVSFKSTRCLCEEPNDGKEGETEEETAEIDVLVFLIRRWIFDFNIFAWVEHNSFHMIGRSACDVPTGWRTKIDLPGPVVDSISDPVAHTWASHSFLHNQQEIIDIALRCFCVAGVVTRRK